MAMVAENVDPKQPRVMHYCKICNRGFGCGGALGGHMRAHVAGDVNVCIHERHPMNNFHDKHQENNRAAYFLRKITINRLTSGGAGEDCAKKFLTLNSFIEHRACTPDERLSAMSSPGSEVKDIVAGGKEFIWCNKKNPSRSSTKMENYDENFASIEEEDLVVAMINKSLALANKKEEKKAKKVVKGMFQCKACKKAFNSHQALGGHRASHKKVKGCFAARFHYFHDGHTEENVISGDEPAEAAATPPTLDLNYKSNDAQFGFGPNNYSKRNPKVHECSICHRKFSSGQALGGHKRCHWLTSNLSETSSMNHIMFKKSKSLDLNLPALLDHAAAKAEVPTKLYLLPRNEDNDNPNQLKFEVPSSWQDVKSEEDHGKRKLQVKLSNLRDMNMDGGSSTWLQVGIASSTDHGGAASASASASAS